MGTCGSENGKNWKENIFNNSSALFLPLNIYFQSNLTGLLPLNEILSRDTMPEQTKSPPEFTL